MMGTILVFLWDKGINRGFLKEFKNKIGHQCKIGLGGKTGTRKNPHGKAHFEACSVCLSVIVFAISCFFSRNGS